MAGYAAGVHVGRPETFSYVGPPPPGAAAAAAAHPPPPAGPARQWKMRPSVGDTVYALAHARAHGPLRPGDPGDIDSVTNVDTEYRVEHGVERTSSIMKVRGFWYRIAELALVAEQHGTPSVGQGRAPPSKAGNYGWCAAHRTGAGTDAAVAAAAADAAAADAAAPAKSRQQDAFEQYWARTSRKQPSLEPQRVAGRSASPAAPAAPAGAAAAAAAGAKRKREPDDNSACVICLDAKKTHIFVPCGHLCVCRGCSAKQKKCPLCRRDCTQVIEAFF